jgi:hypothetical protein
VTQNVRVSGTVVAAVEQRISDAVPVGVGSTVIACRLARVTKLVVVGVLLAAVAHFNTVVCVQQASQCSPP